MPDIPLQDYTAQVKELIGDGRHDEAIAHSKHILAYYPKHVETYSLLGTSCLEKGLHQEAIDCFQRTLSADPENLTARVGLGIVYDRQDALAEAIWQMERAFELAPGSDKVRDELQRLYARRDGAEKERLNLTRGALGRLYGRNGLYERAIAEFAAILDDEPRLPDIQVALTEVLWREGRRLEAVEACLNLLKQLPFCLKANLILGEILARGGHNEAAREKLDVAHALDPANLMAMEVMGTESPLPREQVYLPLLELTPDVLDVVVPGPEESDVREPETSTPAWLREVPPAVPDPGAATAPAMSEQQEDSEETVPDWLVGLAATGVASAGQAGAPGQDKTAAAGAAAAVPSGAVPLVAGLGAEALEEQDTSHAELEQAVAAPLADASAEITAADVPEPAQDLGREPSLDPVSDETVPAAGQPPEPESAAGEELPSWVRSVQAAGTVAAVEQESGSGSEESATAAAEEESQAQVATEPVVSEEEQLQYRHQLEAARRYRDKGDLDAALDEYEQLVDSKELRSLLLDDLSSLLDEDVDQGRAYQLLGDAYMQDDQLDEALEMYRQARQVLH